MAEQLRVTDGDTTEDCTVLETYSHYGHEIAEVEGDTISGFVEFEASDLASHESSAGDDEVPN